MRFHGRLHSLMVGLMLAITSGASVAEAGPSALVATAVSTSGIDLSWSGTTVGWADYIVERSASASTGFAQVAAVGRSLSYQDRGLASGKTYFYRVRETRQNQLSNTATATTWAVQNKPPVANAGPDQMTQAGMTVTFAGTASDPDGTVTSYAWRFGDGGAASGPTVSHVYPVIGTYAATLTVTDNGGLTASDGAVVTVMGAAATTTTTATVTTTTLLASGNLPWARRFGSAMPDYGYGVAVDGGGNILLTGRIQDTANFGVGGSCPRSSAFVAKYSPTGTAVWVRCNARIGDVGGGWGTAIAVDRAGNVAITGTFAGSVDFGGGPIASALGVSDIFVAKYAADGTHLWSRRLGGADYSIAESGYGVAIDGSGNVVATGAFSGTADFGGGPLTAAGNTDIFVAKYSPIGAHLWSRRIGSSAYKNNAGKGVAVDGSGNVVLTGTFGGSADFGGGLLTSSLGNSIFLAKYSPTGSHLWSRRFGGSLSDSGNAVAVDATGYVTMTGQFIGAVDFGTGPLAYRNDTDVFVARFSPTGSTVWAKAFGSYRRDAGNGVAVDAAGNVVVTGIYGDATDFGGGALPFAGGGDIFLAKYSAAGVHLWSAGYGAWDLDIGRAVAVDGGGNIAVGGDFTSTINFGPGPLTVVGGGSDADMFVFVRRP